jgi:hypothetical protein
MEDYRTGHEKMTLLRLAAPCGTDACRGGKKTKTRLKEIALQLCTCTWIEIMTGIGITAYLAFGLHDIRLAILTAGVFAPLVGFHFAVSRLSPPQKKVAG